MGPYKKMWTLHALNEIFDLNDNQVEAMDNVLIGMVGEGVHDL